MSGLTGLAEKNGEQHNLSKMIMLHRNVFNEINSDVWRYQ